MFEAKFAKVGQDVHLKIRGALDESVQLPEIPDVDGQLIIDVSGISMINSLGCRNWINWAKTLRASGGMVIRECSPVFLKQVAILQGFIPPGMRIESCRMPYVCVDCEHEETVVSAMSELATQRSCPCGGAMEPAIPLRLIERLSKKSA